MALADLDAGVSHPFGEPTKYELFHDGKRYAPKAVIGLAARHLTGRLLPPQEFSGGEAPGQANYVLRRLGFTVVQKADEPEPRTGKDWTPDEVALVVADYFGMLQKELFGKPYSKTAHRDALRPLLRGRTTGSVEFKHQNISAVLIRMGLPYISGYKPKSNYQALLAKAVDSYLVHHPTYLNQLADAPSSAPDQKPGVPTDWRC